jgi:Fic family protein
MANNYLSGLDNDLKQSLQEQLRILWTYNSNAIEGNSLTLGESYQVLTEGLTINGKPLSHHNEVVGHAKALDLIHKYDRAGTQLTNQEIFDLHKAIQSQIIIDAYHPIGDWKKEPNSTSVILDEQTVINDTYALPDDVADLMKVWLERLNCFLNKPNIRPVKDYVWLHASFVRIHPFADGNGRLTRLLSNLPLLVSGFPPLVIDNTKRFQYIRTLAKWQISIGRPTSRQALIIENEYYSDFEDFCEDCWKSSYDLVEKAHDLQRKRYDSQIKPEG